MRRRTIVLMLAQDLGDVGVDVDLGLFPPELTKAVVDRGCSSGVVHVVQEEGLGQRAVSLRRVFGRLEVAARPGS